MWAVGIERRGSRGATATDALQYPQRYSVHGTVHELERDIGPAARTGNAGRGASPTAGKREGFSF
jgi:hypothetical protein